MPEGTIKRLTDKGFGFISTGGTKDLFFHSSKVVEGSFDQLFEGQKVSFTEREAGLSAAARDLSNCPQHPALLRGLANV
jgi:cold shock protein